MAGFTLIFRMNGIREVDGFVGRQIIQQVFIKCDECGLLFNISHTGQRLWFAILEPQTGQKLDAARMRIIDVKL